MQSACIGQQSAPNTPSAVRSQGTWLAPSNIFSSLLARCLRFHLHTYLSVFGTGSRLLGQCYFSISTPQTSRDITRINHQFRCIN
jgi:hypothetical protein